MDRLREQVENQIGKFNENEWNFAKDEIGRNRTINKPRNLHDETTIDILALNINFYRKHNLEVE